MKYIKTYDSIGELPKLKKYIVWQLENIGFDIYVVFEVLDIYFNLKRINVDERIFLKLKRYDAYSDRNKEWLGLEDLIVDRAYYKDEILYQSDHLEDCISFAELVPESNKFNI